MQSSAKTVNEYLRELPDDRRKAISAVRAVIRENLQPGFEEGMQYGMIGYFVPHSIYPAGYHCDPKQPLPFTALASQKNAMSLYLMACYGDEEEQVWLRDQFTKAGKKLDMGKSCIWFKKLDDLPLDVVGAAIRRTTVPDYIAAYESARPAKKPGKSAKAAATPTKSPAKKSAAKKSTPTKAPAKKSVPKKRSPPA